MVYKKYVKRGGKVYGPYYYKNIRDKNGNVRNIFLGTKPPKKSFINCTTKYWPLIIVLLSLSLLLVIDNSYTTFSVYNEKTMVKDVNLNFNSNSEYDIDLEDINSLKLSGIAEGTGYFKIYLNDLLVADSTNLITTSAILENNTGQNLESITNDNTTSSLIINNFTEINESVKIEENMTLNLEVNFTNNDINSTNINETINQSKNKILVFEDICIETCSLDQLENVTLKVEIENVTLNLTKIKYTKKLELDVELLDINDSEIENINLEKREDGKFNIDMFNSKNKIEINGVKNKVKAKIGNISDENIKTEVFAVKSVDIDNATITLKKYGNVNVILECNKFNFGMFSCDEWLETNITFEDDGDTITFNVNHFSAYAGAEIIIINVQSFPSLYGNWTVRFNTSGKANLTIKAINNTEFNRDIEFKELRCGNNTLNPVINNGAIFYQDYECNETGYEISKVLIAGKHTLEFKFGDKTAYAYNNPGAPTIKVDSPNVNLTADFNLTVKWTAWDPDSDTLTVSCYVSVDNSTSDYHRWHTCFESKEDDGSEDCRTLYFEPGNFYVWCEANDGVEVGKNYSKGIVKIEHNNSWPMYGANLAHTDFSTSRMNLSNFTQLWNFSIFGGSGSTILWSGFVVYGDKIFFATNYSNSDSPGYVFALNATTGEQLWNFSMFRQSIAISALVTNDTVYTGGHNYTYSLYSANGTQKQNYSIGGEKISSSFTLDFNNYLYFQTYDLDHSGYLQNASTLVLNASNLKQQIWNFSIRDTDTKSSSSVSLAEGMAFFHILNNNTLFAVNTTNGVAIWNASVPNAHTSTPTLKNGTLYFGPTIFGGGTGYVLRLNLSNGYQFDNFSRTAPGTNGTSGSALAYGKLYVATHENRTYALNASNLGNSSPQMIANYTLTAPITRLDPVIADNYLFIADDKSKFFVLNASDLTHIWNYTMDNETFSYSPLAIAKEIVYAGTLGGYVYAFTTNRVPKPTSLNLNSTDINNRTNATLNGKFIINLTDKIDLFQRNETKWFNNTVEVTKLRNKSDISSGNTTKHQNWTFSMRVYDGFKWSDWYNTTNISIKNAHPDHTNPILNTEDNNNRTNSNITALNQSTADVDNDNVTNIYNWHLNNASFAVLNMPFEGGSNSTFTKDLSAFWKDVNILNAVWNSTGGVKNFNNISTGAYQFDGNHSMINITSGLEHLNFTKSITIEAWVKLKNLRSTSGDYGGTAWPIVIKSIGNETSGGGGYGLTIKNASILHFYKSNGSSNNGGGNCSLMGSDNIRRNRSDCVYYNIIDKWNTNEWHHVVATWNGTTNKNSMKLYVDGILVNQTTPLQATIGTNNRTVMIGGFYSGPNINTLNNETTLNGTLDEIRMYNRTLTIEQIKTHYNNGSARFNRIHHAQTDTGERWKASVTPSDGDSNSLGTTYNTSELTVEGVPELILPGKPKTPSEPPEEEIPCEPSCNYANECEEETSNGCEGTCIRDTDGNSCTINNKEGMCTNGICIIEECENECSFEYSICSGVSSIENCLLKEDGCYDLIQEYCLEDERCVDGSCIPVIGHCLNGIKDFDEEKTDCGGSCPSCEKVELPLIGLIVAENTKKCFNTLGLTYEEIERMSNLLSLLPCDPAIEPLEKIESKFRCKGIEVDINEILRLRGQIVNKKPQLSIITSTNFTEECPWCFNGIQDFDEEGTDCGGSCPSCEAKEIIEEGFKEFPYWLIILLLLSSASAIGAHIYL